MVTAVYGRDGGISVEGSGNTRIKVGMGIPSSKVEVGCEDDEVTLAMAGVVVSAISISFHLEGWTVTPLTRQISVRVP
jgi:hypothetical protein